MIVTGEIALTHVNAATSRTDNMITKNLRREVKRRYLISLPAYKPIDNVHNVQFPELETPHTTLLHPDRALSQLYALQSTSRLTEGYFKGHACETEDEDITSVTAHKLCALPFWSDSFPVGGMKGADSLLLCSTQFPRWTDMAAGNPKTMLPLLISSGSDGSIDNEILVDAEFERMGAAINTVVAKPFKDRWSNEHTLTMKGAMLVVSVTFSVKLFANRTVRLGTAHAIMIKRDELACD